MFGCFGRNAIKISKQRTTSNSTPPQQQNIQLSPNPKESQPQIVTVSYNHDIQSPGNGGDEHRHSP